MSASNYRFGEKLVTTPAGDTLADYLTAHPEHQVQLPTRCATPQCSLALGHAGAHHRTTRAGVVTIGGAA